MSESLYLSALLSSLRLVGYIVRQSENNGVEGTKYSCFVYEADVSGTDVCSALGVAAKAAYEQLLEKKTFEKKRKQETVRIFLAFSQIFIYGTADHGYTFYCLLVHLCTLGANNLC